MTTTSKGRQYQDVDGAIVIDHYPDRVTIRDYAAHLQLTWTGSPQVRPLPSSAPASLGALLAARLASKLGQLGGRSRSKKKLAAVTRNLRLAAARRKGGN